MTTRRIFDVDIDVASKTEKHRYGTRAMVYNREVISPHPSGFYLEDVPTDPETGLCAFDAEYGDGKGFQKVDLLSNTTYDSFSSKDEVLEFLEAEVDWDLFLDESVVETLPHISKHFDLCYRLMPKSIDDLADILALIRPGKMHLLDRYIVDKKKTRAILYKRVNAHYFKKAHAYSYAAMIICSLNKKHRKLFSF